MINLFENYKEREKDLEHSLTESGQTHLTIVLNDDGFLPVHVVSPIGFFTRWDMYKKTSHDKPKFFNNLVLPDYWEIRASGRDANIFEGYKKRGHISYSNRPGDYRFIQEVEWFNESGRVRAVDMYNQNGVLFGKKTYSDGAHALTTYFDVAGQETLLFNHVLQTIQLNFNQKKYIFSDYVSFILFYLEVAKLPTQRILYNSLGRPFFVTSALQKRFPEIVYKHILFWQEISQKMPGNMEGIVQSNSSATAQIVVQDRAEYERLINQVPSECQVELSYLGYLYNFKREVTLKPKIFIHTNSDQLESIQELIGALPMFQFHISARTEMSPKLMQLENNANVSLYPNISSEELQHLLSESSFYLDVNHGGEIDNIVRQAFEHNLLLFSFTQTIHNSRMISPTHVFDKSEHEHLAKELQALIANSSHYTKALELQRHNAGQMTVEKYKEVMA